MVSAMPFLQASSRFDTLLQMASVGLATAMGNYDLCRTWIDSSVAQDFRYIADAVDELRPIYAHV